MSSTERVLVGTLGKPHGLRGELTVHLHTDEPERRFATGAAVEVGQGGKPMTVTSARWNSGVLLLGLSGSSDRTAAEGLRGAELWARVPSDEAPTGDDEYYDRQLVGLGVLDASGARRGTVKAVLHNPGQDLLEVDVDGVRRLIPFVSALVPRVDLDAGVVQIAPVEGLLEDPED